MLSGILLAAVLIIAPSAAAQPPAGNAAERIPVFIGFRSTPGASEQALVRAHGGLVKYSYTIVPAIAAWLPEQAVQALQANPAVVLIEPVIEAYAVDFQAELDNTWGVKRIGGGIVHDTGYLGTGVKVAVIDSGVDYTHPDLQGNYVPTGSYDFVNDDEYPMDDAGHGTHVAGTIAALRNGTGVVGAAPAVQIYALKVLGADGSGTYDDIIAAVNHCVAKGFCIANLSLGSSQDPGIIVQTAFDNAYDAGLLIVASAGNSGKPTGRGDNVGYPARYDSVIAVAASSSSDIRASFSSTGPAVELTAPGVAVNSTKLGGGYVEFNGTSMASPHVAGAAALVWAADLDLSNAAVRAILAGTAQDLGVLGRDSLYGYGLVRADLAVQAVAPPEPTVIATVTTDKDYYVSGTDLQARVYVLATDENGDPIDGLDSDAFVTTLDGEQTLVLFSETTTSGMYVGSLDISSLSAGTHTVAVTVTAGGISGTGSYPFAVGSVLTVSVPSINYSLSVNRKHLTVTVPLSPPVSGATVGITLMRNGSYYATRTGTTGSSGAAAFTFNNAPSGTYVTTVNSVSAAGYAWDGKTPTNSYTKP
jgi:subtilisin